MRVARRERRAALEALAGEALEDLGSEFNPVLEDGEGRAPDDEHRQAEVRGFGREEYAQKPARLRMQTGQSP